MRGRDFPLPAVHLTMIRIAITAAAFDPSEANS